MSDLKLARSMRPGNGLNGHCVTDGCRAWFDFNLHKLITDRGRIGAARILAWVYLR
jgi:hypothetical protein